MLLHGNSEIYDILNSSHNFANASNAKNGSSHDLVDSGISNPIFLVDNQ